MSVCIRLSLVFESHTFVALCPVALIFEGSVNPAHPKHIGSIDPSCDVVEVVKGNESHTHTHTLDVLSVFHHCLFVQVHDCSTFYDLLFIVNIQKVLFFCFTL